MAHHTAKSNYKRLLKRLNKFPQGAVPSETLYKIFEILFSEKEAGLLSLLPIKPFTLEKAAKAWKIKEVEARNILDSLAGRGVLIDFEEREKRLYVLPPPVVGFFEFSMMRIREDIDQEILSKLYYRYLDEEEDFIKELFTGGQTQIGRIFVQETTLSDENALHVLDYEKASEVIKTSSYIGVSLCYCRHKMQHVGRVCKAPLEICMSFNEHAALPLIKHGLARQVDSSECMDLLNQAYENKLVQFGSNVMKHVNFICNCCGCCCEAMIAAKKFGILTPVHTTNFIPCIDEKTCSGCGKCINVCPIEAMVLVSENNPQKPQKRKAKLNEKTCLGCGVCVTVCPPKSISLNSRKERVLTPVDSVQRVVTMAIERGKLQNLIFDNQALMSHRAMAAVLGVILKLPPVKQAMVKKQMKSMYIAQLIDKK